MIFKFCTLFLGALPILLVSSAEQISNRRQENSPYLEFILCPTKAQPWDCARQQSRRLLDRWNNDLSVQWDGFKVEADTELNRTLESRGYSAGENNIKEKPSTILSKIAIGVNYIQDVVKTTTNRLLGLEEENDDDDYYDDDASIEQSDDGRGKHDKKKKKKGDILPLLQQELGDLDIFGNVLHSGGHGNKLGIKFPHKYGRSVGEIRGKKKKKKVLMKLVLLGTLIKGKIELLLKLLSAHLQMKFLVIALVGLLINVARFWMDLKKGQQPQKVIYYEHAHHQHHYDDHGDDWGGEPGGGLWKRRSFDADENPSGRNSRNLFNFTDVSHTGSKDYAQILAYRSQVPSVEEQQQRQLQQQQQQQQQH